MPGSQQRRSQTDGSTVFCFVQCNLTLIIVSLAVQGGNNNTYCHDSELNWFNWDQAMHDDTGYARFFRCLVNLR